MGTNLLGNPYSSTNLLTNTMAARGDRGGIGEVQIQTLLTLPMWLVRRVTRHWLFLLSLLATGCADMDPTGTAALTAQIERARTRWRAAALTSYGFTSATLCFCPVEFVQPRRVTVRDGVVYAVVDARTLQPMPLTRGHTVDSLFTLALHEARTRPAGLDVTFDATLGFPRRLSYGNDPMIADGEVVITIDSLSANP
jgi:Family of unknown function (DUF6174)